MRRPIPNAGTAIPHSCPVCDLGLPSGMALFRHLKSHHPNDRSYECRDCQTFYNNLKELSSHRSNVHHNKFVKCTHCEYQATSCVKMQQHVHCHTQGLLCRKCSKAFPTLVELSHHKHLHDPRDTFECKHCGAEYFTSASLHIHVVGKHGPGYVCTKCNTRFDTPSQRARH